MNGLAIGLLAGVAIIGGIVGVGSVAIKIDRTLHRRRMRKMAKRKKHLERPAKLGSFRR